MDSTTSPPPRPVALGEKREFLIVVVLFAIAAILRLVFHYSAEMVPPAIRADSLRYLVTAINLAEFGAYSYEMVEPFPSSTLLVPGYPWLLSVIHRLGGSPAATLAAAFHVQIVLGALTVVLTYLVARRVLSVALAVVPALLMAVVPHQVVAPSFLLTETLFCFLLMSALYALLLAMETGKQRFWVLFALLVAYATLTRPVLLLLPPVMLLFLRDRPCIKPLLFASATVLVAYSSWAYWGKHHADRQESNMRAVVAIGSYPDFTYANFRGFPNREDPVFEQSIASWPALLSYIGERAREQPFEYFSWYAFRKPLSLWEFNLVQGTGAYTYPVSSSVYDYPGLFRWTYSFTSLVYPVIVVIALLTAIASCLMALLPRWGRPPPALLICSIVMLYATFFHVPLATLPRFSIPFQAVMLVLVVAGAWTGGLQLWSKLRAGEKAS